MVLESAGDAIVASQQYQAETREIQNLDGLLNFMDVDASEISLSYVSDNVVKLAQCVRGVHSSPSPACSTSNVYLSPNRSPDLDPKPHHNPNIRCDLCGG